jgi:hypothetical protein
MAMLDDHYAVMMGMPIVMSTKLGAGAQMTMAALLDYNGFSASDRRRCDSDRSQCGKDVSKLLHAVLLG